VSILSRDWASYVKTFSQKLLWDIFAVTIVVAALLAAEFQMVARSIRSSPSIENSQIGRGHGISMPGGDRADYFGA
jgi:hypothetical protein